MDEVKENTIVDDMVEVIKLNTENQSENVKKGIDKAVENIFVNGMAPKDAFAVEEDTVEAISTEAYRLYNSGKYEEAMHLFSTLALIDCSYPYLFSIAACNHMMKEYEKAAEIYVRSALLSPDDPSPYYHAADCYLNLNKIVSAMIALQMVEKRAGEKPQYSTMKDRAKIMLDNLSKGQK